MQHVRAASPSARGASIMVVDDDPDMREGLCDALTDEGYLVTSASNGRDAFQRLSGTVAPDLILMDLRMPEMDGYQFLERRDEDKTLSKVPVIVISASIGKGISQEGVQILHKPVDLDALLSLIRRQLG